MTQVQPRECPEPSEVLRGTGGSILGSSRDRGPPDNLILDFWSPEHSEGQFLLFEVPSAVMLGGPQETRARTHLEVVARAEEDVGSCGMPLDQAHPAGVAH